MKTLLSPRLKDAAAWLVILGAPLAFWLQNRANNGPVFLADEIGYLANATIPSGHLIDGAWLGPWTFTYMAGCDFDGDGKTGPAKYDSSTRLLSWLNSSTGLWSSVSLGTGSYTLALGQ